RRGVDFRLDLFEGLLQLVNLDPQGAAVNADLRIGTVSDDSLQVSAELQQPALGVHERLPRLVEGDEDAAATASEDLPQLVADLAGGRSVQTDFRHRNHSFRETSFMITIRSGRSTSSPPGQTS